MKPEAKLEGWFIVQRYGQQLLVGRVMNHSRGVVFNTSLQVTIPILNLNTVIGQAETAHTLYHLGAPATKEQENEVRSRPGFKEQGFS